MGLEDQKKGNLLQSVLVGAAMVGIIKGLLQTGTFKLTYYRDHGLLEEQSRGHGSEKIENH